MFGRKKTSRRNFISTPRVSPRPRFGQHPIRKNNRKAPADAPLKIRSNTGFDMGGLDRLTADWVGTNLTMNQMLFSQMDLIRKRARDQEINSPWVRRFLAMARTNVVGSSGFRLTARVMNGDGNPDKEVNEEIERAFNLWSKPDTCTMSGKQSLIDICNQGVTRLFADGEYIIRMVGGSDNPFGFSLAPLPIDLLDQNLNRDSARNTDGRAIQNAIKLGVEVDEWDRPVAYHFLDQSENAMSGGYTGMPGSHKHIIYPAEEIIHIFPIERTGQSRGFSFIAPAGTRTKMLTAYEEAAVIHKRIAACKMGFLIPDAENPPADGYKGDGANPDGSTSMEIEPGIMEKLPLGYGFEAFDPSDPGDGFEEFSKTILRSISSAWNVNYNTLANDLSEVNYSSIRHGALEDRDAWMCVQRFIIEHMMERIYPQWLKWTLIMGYTFLPITRFERFLRISFRGRRWQWIDPLKEENANNKALINQTTSEIEIAETKGADFFDIVEERVRAKEVLEKAGFAVVGAAVAEKPTTGQA